MMIKNKKELTKAEEQIMQYLWRIEKGFVKDIIEQFPEPKPAYTTITTMIRILVRKGFVGYHQYGKTNEYYPLISKSYYLDNHLKQIVKRYFNGSITRFASFFAQDDDLSISELEAINKLIKNQIKKRKTNE
jgi:BlaI family penicillinase repressor